MTKSELRAKLRDEVERWSSRTFDELAATRFPAIAEFGAPRSTEYYQAEVTLLERTEEYIHLAVAVSSRGWRVLFPATDDLIVYRKAE